MAKLEKQKVETRLVGVDKAAEMTGISVWTWRRWCYAGRCASVKLGRRLLIPVSELDRLISAGTRDALQASKALSQHMQQTVTQ